VGFIRPERYAHGGALPGTTGQWQLTFGKERPSGGIPVRGVAIAPKLVQNRPAEVGGGGSHISPGRLPDRLWERGGTPQIQRAAVIVRCPRLDIHIRFAFPRSAYGQACSIRISVWDYGAPHPRIGAHGISADSEII
jgi:hypothetical protein